MELPSRGFARLARLVGERMASTRLARGRSAMALLGLGLSAAIYVVLGIATPTDATILHGAYVPVVYHGAVLALGCLSLIMLATDSESVFHTSISLHFVLSVLLLLLFRLPDGSTAVLLIAGLVPLSIYESYPLNLSLCAVYGTLLVAARGLWGGSTALSLVCFALVGTAVSLLGSLMGRYWEAFVALQSYATRLEDNVTALARANSMSQDYARDIEEESRVAERLSLTRDIHDAIGYTLTNTIMAMEAVKMMVGSEPERVAEYLEATRRDTEEGLAHIKRILREFRAKQKVEDSCLLALKKLVKVFTLSTGLSVRFEFGNLDVATLDRFGECVYHFVQEGLINAFRHGRAERVILLFWDYGGSLRVTLDDDGSGCPEPVVPGIGVAGMIERASAFGGKVAVERATGGFRISMYLMKGVVDGAAG